MTEEEKRNQAWIGDAVLALYARKWILQQAAIGPKERAEVFIRMTSNKFLSAIGEPTAMEAEIGQVYENDGLEAAFTHIEEKFVPLFKKQQAKAKQPGSYRTKKGRKAYPSLRQS
ncbi:MAG: ribonuclease III domain-containing protein [Verrucomicrobiota bacterium]